MKVLLKNGIIYYRGCFSQKNVVIDNGIVGIDAANDIGKHFDEIFDVPGCYIFPGLADVHVHLREPGFSYKETIESGTKAAARGGYTTVCAMPNLNPPPDSINNLKIELDIIRQSARIRVLPFACITNGGSGRGAVTNIKALAPFAVGFSDDGKGVQSAETMLEAMNRVAKSDSIIAAHCEDEELICGGYINDGDYARSHGHRGISSESEWRQLERDLELVRKTGCKYHVCHVSTAESVALIRRAKASGLPVSCETSPHYLLLTDDDLREEGRFKMNPPLRSAKDRAALIEGVVDGTIDMIATDHAPHAPEEKNLGLEKSAMGVTGLEIALPLIYTELVSKGVIGMERLIALMCVAPRNRFCLGEGEIKPGEAADLVVFDPIREFIIDSSNFLSKGRATPFDNRSVRGEVLLTICAGKQVWRSKRMGDHNIIM